MSSLKSVLRRHPVGHPKTPRLHSDRVRHTRSSASPDPPSRARLMWLSVLALALPMVAALGVARDASAQSGPVVGVPSTVVSDGTWVDPVPIGAGDIDSASTDLELGGSGAGVTVWRERDDGTWRVRGRIRNGAKTWGAPVWLSPAGMEAEHPQVAVAGPEWAFRFRPSLAVVTWLIADGGLGAFRPPSRALGILGARHRRCRPPPWTRPTRRLSSSNGTTGGWSPDRWRQFDGAHWRLQAASMNIQGAVAKAAKYLTSASWDLGELQVNGEVMMWTTTDGSRWHLKSAVTYDFDRPGEAGTRAVLPGRIRDLSLGLDAATWTAPDAGTPRTWALTEDNDANDVASSSPRRTSKRSTRLYSCSRRGRARQIDR